MIREQPLVSVIIPCYNSAAFVKVAINSIINQSYQNLEIFLIDDASTDDTLSVLRAFADKRIKVLDFKINTKKVGAVNEAMKIVNGEFIAFQDSDDYSEPDRIKYQVGEFLKDNQLGVCFTKYKFCGDKNYVAENVSLSNSDLKSEFLHYQYKRKAGHSPTCCPSMMIHKNVISEIGGYHPYFAGKIGEDAHWIYRILKKFKGITVNEVLYNYYVRKGSLMTEAYAGKNVKFNYSLPLLHLIIKKDVEENIDVLNATNALALRDLELQACEMALTDKILDYHNLQLVYENSKSFKIGKKIIGSLMFFKKLFN